MSNNQTLPVGPKTPALILNVEEVQALDKLIGDLPTRFGYPLIDFFKKVNQRLADEAKTIQAQEESPKKSFPEPDPRPVYGEGSKG